MKRIAFIAGAALLGTSPVWAGHEKFASANQCQAPETKLIGGETRCVSTGGIDIGYYEDDGIKVACMQDKRVRQICGPDGRITRLEAFKAWYGRLKAFEDSCAASGGVFSFSDPNFTEPQDESFCQQAQPEIGTNMFEEQLCNYRSTCPNVSVNCEHPCKDEAMATSPYDAPPAALTAFQFPPKSHN